LTSVEGEAEPVLAPHCFAHLLPPWPSSLATGFPIGLYMGLSTPWLHPLNVFEVSEKVETGDEITTTTTIKEAQLLN
jgi:hypothetical protein